jgi:hypothetical protein
LVEYGFVSEPARGGIVKFLAAVLRVWSCAFALLIGLFLMGLATLIVTSDIHNIDMTMLPWWKGTTLTVMLFIFGLSGILAGILAALRKVRPLLVLYTLVALAVIVDGFFLNATHRFDGKAGAMSATWLALAALLAVAGSFAQFGNSRKA